MRFLLVRATYKDKKLLHQHVFFLLSYNILLYMYEYESKNNMLDLYDFNIDDIYDNGKLDTLVKKGDIEGLKDYIFGKEMGSLVDLSINKMHIGTRASGVKVNAVYEYDNHLRFEEIVAEEGLDRDNKDDRLKVKLALAGKEVTCGFFNSGIVCKNTKDLEYIGRERCIAIIQQDEIVAKVMQFNNLYTRIPSVDKSNISCSNLVNSTIGKIQNSTLEFHNTVFLRSTIMEKSNIILDNTVLADFEWVKDCRIKFTGSVHKLSMGGYEIKNSEIIFDCDVNEKSFQYDVLHNIDKSVIVFRRKVSILALRMLIHGIVNNAGMSKNRVKLIVNKQVYKNCVEKLDSTFLSYIQTRE